VSSALAADRRRPVARCCDSKRQVVGESTLRGLDIIGGVTEDEVAHLRRAIAVSRRARGNGNHPFGAVLVDAAGEVVAEAENTVVTDSDPTGHAEINLVRVAGHIADGDDLVAYTLYSSCEPCAMCAAAIFWSGIGRLVYALSNESLIASLPDGGGPALDLGARVVLAAGSRPVAVEGPLLEEEAAGPHAGFWG